MSDLGPVISQAAAQNGVPEPLLRAVLQTESGVNPNTGDSTIAPAVGTERATGIAQIKPSTARGLGVDPRNPVSAIGGAAKYLAQGYQQYGNWDDAARFYHGGPNQKLWGARTEDYHAKITRAAAQAPQASAPAAAPSDNPFTAAITGAPTQSSAPAAPTDNPFTAAINGGTQSNADSANSGAPNGSPSVLGRPDGQAQSGGAGSQGGVPASGAPGPQTGPQQAPTGIQGLASSIDAGVRGVDNGFLGGFGDKVTAGINAVLPIDALTGRPVESIWNGKGFEKAYGHNLALERAASDVAMSQHPIASVGGELAGIIANPLSKLGAPVEGSSALFNMGRLAATGGAFGGAYGAGQSRASDLAGLARDTAVGAGAGAVLAPLAGAAGEKLLTPIVDAARGIGGKLAATNSAQKIGDLAEALSKRTAPKAAEEAGAVPDMFAPKTVQTGAQVAGGKPAPMSEAEVSRLVDQANALPAMGPADPKNPELVVDVVGGQPAAADIATARGSRGTRTGIEANASVPAPVASHIAELQAKGVPLDQAVREAEITYVGGSPTAADVTRDPAMMRQTREGAKLDTPEGQALSQQQAQNNAAVIGKTVDTVNGYGGAQAPGAAMENAATALKQAADTQYKGVTQAYKAAREQDGAAYVKPDALNAVLSSPEAKAQIAGGGAEGQLLKTTKALVDSYSNKGKQGLSPDQYNEIVKAANGKFDKMGGGVNHWIDQVKQAADDSMAQFDAAGPAYKAARAKMADYASQYRAPKGVANLIRQDAKGNFLNADNWRATDGLITKTSDKEFVQIAGQLKAIGANDALDQLKAHIVQNAYETATGRNGGTAIDQLGNSPMSGKMFHGQLNKIGKAKLEALFTPDEIAHLSTLGHAASHINEAVPGTVNTSNTASALANALEKSRKAGASADTAGNSLTGTIAGAVMGGLTHGLEGAGIGAAAGVAGKVAEPFIAKRAAAKASEELAKALRTASSPAATRKAEEDHAKKLADALIARVRANRVAVGSGPEVQKSKEGLR